MEDTLHALALIGLVPLGAALIWFFRAKPESVWHFQAKPESDEKAHVRSGSAASGLLAFLLVFVVSAGWGPAYAFGPRIFAIYQVLIPALVAAVSSAYIANRWIRWGSNVGFVLVSMSLSMHFLTLVATDVSRCEFTGHTDKFVSYRCDTPAEAYRLWHTSFTGIYGLRKQ